MRSLLLAAVAALAVWWPMHRGLERSEAALAAQAALLRQASLDNERLRSEVGRLKAAEAAGRWDPATRYVRATVTAYTPGPESTGKRPGHPAYNRVAWRGYRGAPGTCAADTRVYPFGTVLRVEGLGFCVVADRGGAIRGPGRVDWYVAGPHESAVYVARRWGRRTVAVEVVAIPGSGHVLLGQK